MTINLPKFLQPKYFVLVYLIRFYGAEGCSMAQCHDMAMLAQSKVKLGQYFLC